MDPLNSIVDTKESHFHKIYTKVLYQIDFILCRIFPDKDNSPIYCFSAIMFYTYIQTKIIFFLIKRISDVTKIGTTFLGLTLICWGGCVGDVMNAAIAVKHKANKLLITSIIGSQVINLQLCLGLPWCITILKSYFLYNDRSFRILFQATDIVNYLIPAAILISLSVFILWLFNLNLNRKCGYCLIVAYVCYLVYEFNIK
jgi:Ca2+/Na+ antiporter